jgi:hypothetical protein
MNVDHPLSIFLTFAGLTIIMQGKAGYPYWYFGTDGATAFDPADANITDPSMVAELVGEIGVSPFGMSKLLLLFGNPELNRGQKFVQTI